MIKLAQNNKLDPRLWAQQYGDIFYGYAMRRLNDSQAAEDVVQETFLAAIRCSNSFRGDSLESTWLSSILRNKTVDVIRKRERRRNANLGLDATEVDDFSENECRDVIGASFSASPLKAMIDTELIGLVHDAIAHLPKNQADVFVLHEFEKLEPEEICKILEISRGNLWVRLRRARVGLGKRVTKMLADVDSNEQLQEAVA